MQQQTCGDGLTVTFWLSCGGHLSAETLTNCPSPSSVELAMTRIATLIQPRHKRAQKTPRNPNMATAYRSGTRQHPATQDYF